MQAGKLRFRVTIEANPQVRESMGAPSADWVPVATVWCDIKPLSGRELLTAQAVQSEITVRIVMRYRADITADMRVNYNGTIYSIQSVINTDSRRRELQLMCGQGLNNG